MNFKRQDFYEGPVYKILFSLPSIINIKTSKNSFEHFKRIIDSIKKPQKFYITMKGIYDYIIILCNIMYNKVLLPLLNKSLCYLRFLFFLVNKISKAKYKIYLLKISLHCNTMLYIMSRFFCVKLDDFWGMYKTLSSRCIMFHPKKFSPETSTIGKVTLIWW